MGSDWLRGCFKPVLPASRALYTYNKRSVCAQIIREENTKHAPLISLEYTVHRKNKILMNLLSQKLFYYLYISFCSASASQHYPQILQYYTMIRQCPRIISEAMPVSKNRDSCAMTVLVSYGSVLFFSSFVRLVRFLYVHFLYAHFL